MTILHRREAGLRPHLSEWIVRGAGRMSGEQGPLTGAWQVTALFCNSCLEGDGVENRVLVAVHQVSDMWASPGLERTLFTGRHVGERTDAAGICDHHCRWKPGGVGILGGLLLVCVHV